MRSTYQQINTDPGNTVPIIQPQSWVLVSVSCDTVGPVIVGSNADLKTGTGQGILVSVTPRYLFLEPGDILYVYSAGTDVVDLAVHPLSWLPMLLQKMASPVPPPPPAPAPLRMQTPVFPPKKVL